MSEWKIGLSGCQLLWVPTFPWKGDGHFPNNGPSSFSYSQSSPMTSNINLAQNLGCPSTFYNQQHIKSFGPDDIRSFVVTSVSHFNPDSQSIQRKENGTSENWLLQKYFKKMNSRKAGLNLITKDPTIKSGEQTRSLRWPHSKRLRCCFAYSFSAGAGLGSSQI